MGPARKTSEGIRNVAYLARMRGTPLIRDRVANVWMIARSGAQPAVFARGFCAVARGHGEFLTHPDPGGVLRPVQALGNFIGGAFVPPSGSALVSRNPAADGAVVFETGYTAAAAKDAVVAAAAAQPAWAALTTGQRAVHLERFKAELASRADALADAIVLETGKLRSEAKTEVTTLLNRFDLVKAAMAGDLRKARSQARTGRAPSLRGARRDRGDRAVQLPAPSLPRARRARAARRQHRRRQAERHHAAVRSALRRGRRRRRSSPTACST
jgi:hypothetical protein